MKQRVDELDGHYLKRLRAMVARVEQRMTLKYNALLVENNRQEQEPLAAWRRLKLANGFDEWHNWSIHNESFADYAI